MLMTKKSSSATFPCSIVPVELVQNDLSHQFIKIVPPAWRGQLRPSRCRPLNSSSRVLQALSRRSGPWKEAIGERTNAARWDMTRINPFFSMMRDFVPCSIDFSLQTTEFKGESHRDSPCGSLSSSITLTFAGWRLKR